ncbi:hypothetical protein [Paludibacter sp. 221]|nr:hypothetical protein [Paludibacter sp. 221]
MPIIIKRIRKHIRNYAALLIRYYRWRNNPNNWEQVARLDMWNKANEL